MTKRQLLVEAASMIAVLLLAYYIPVIAGSGTPTFEQMLLLAIAWVVIRVASIMLMRQMAKRRQRHQN